MRISDWSSDVCSSDLKTVGKRPASNAGGCEMKRILVPVLGDAGDRPALDMAAVVARRHGAHIDAMLFRRDPRDMIPLGGEAFQAARIETLVQNEEAEGGAAGQDAPASSDRWDDRRSVGRGARV